MHSEKDPTRQALPGRPAPRKGGLTLTRLVLGTCTLLVLAWYIGKRDAPRAPTTAQTDATPSVAAGPTRGAARSEAHVVQGKKSTTLATLDEARMRVVEQGEVLRIEGSVGRNFAQDLQAALDANPSLRRIDITSGGGYAKPGLDTASTSTPSARTGHRCRAPTSSGISMTATGGADPSPAQLHPPFQGQQCHRDPDRDVGRPLPVADALPQ